MKNEEIKLYHIKLTPDIINTINQLQTGGTSFWDHAPDEEMFNNNGLNDRLNELTRLTDLLISIHIDHDDALNEHDCMQHLADINYMKVILSSLAAPQPEKQNANS